MFGYGADKKGSWHHYWEYNKYAGAFRKTGVHNADFETVIIQRLNKEGKIKLYRWAWPLLMVAFIDLVQLKSGCTAAVWKPKRRRTVIRRTINWPLWVALNQTHRHQAVVFRPNELLLFSHSFYCYVPEEKDGCCLPPKSGIETLKKTNSKQNSLIWASLCTSFLSQLLCLASHSVWTASLQHDKTSFM